MKAKAIYLGHNKLTIDNSNYIKHYFAIMDGIQKKEDTELEGRPVIYEELSLVGERNELLDVLPLGEMVPVQFSLNQGNDSRGYPRRACQCILEGVSGKDPF